MQSTISGYEVTTEHGRHMYRIKVKEGVRGINIPVTATLIGRTWHITLQGKRLTVESVSKLVPQKKQTRD